MDDEAIREFFEGLGQVEIRRMFGGRGIYCRGLIVGVYLRDELMVKGDEQSGPIYEQEGARRWVYENRRSKKPVAMPYWMIPGEVLDDPDTLNRWTRLAFESAVRAEEAKASP